MLKKTAFYLLIILLALLPFNALLTNYIQFGLHISLPVNAWKEGIVVILTIIGCAEMLRTKKKLHFKALDWAIIAFFSLALVSAVFQTRDIGRIIFGFKYDLEFLWLFLVIRQAFSFEQKERQLLVKTVLTSAAIVVIFAVLQQFILPKDILLLFGYSPNISSWSPGQPLPMYHAVDTNSLVPRIMSTLSGPNQFSAYLLIILPIILLLSWQHRDSQRWAYLLFFLAGVISLFFTYSRSAYIAFAIAVLIGMVIFLRKNKKSIRIIAMGGVIVLVLLAGLAAFKWESIIQLVTRASSTQGHYERTIDGIIYTFQNPLGYGIGNAGPASARFNEDKTGWLPESWYLQISLEMGILGLLLFILILGLTLRELCYGSKATKDHISFALFLGLVSLMITSLVLHSWEESAVALTFWAMAGAVLSSQNELKKQDNTSTMQKKLKAHMSKVKA